MRDELFYAELKTRLFEPTDWYEAKMAARDKPSASFRLDREFDDTSPFLTYDFVTELYQEFGQRMHPIGFSQGCISITVALDEPTDYRGIDFRGLSLSDPDYHEIFRRYGVRMLYFDNFPVRDNANHHRFRVNQQGVPTPF